MRVHNTGECGEFEAATRPATEALETASRSRAQLAQADEKRLGGRRDQARGVVQTARHAMLRRATGAPATRSYLRREEEEDSGK